MLVVWSCVVGWFVVVVVIGVVGRAGCMSLLLVEVAFRGIPFHAVFRRGEPSHVTREVVDVTVVSICL